MVFDNGICGRLLRGKSLLLFLSNKEVIHMGEYPCECVLEFLANEDIWKNGARKVIDTLINEWKYPEYIKMELAKPEQEDEYCLHSGEKTYVLTMSTGGWSGNEELMSAVDRNRHFNHLFWWSERRGGHYVYLIPAKYYDDNFILSKVTEKEKAETLMPWTKKEEREVCPVERDPLAICNKGLACDGCELYKEDKP